MNFEDHILTASGMLNAALIVWVALEHADAFILSRLLSLFVSLFFFFFGVQVVDWEQPAVQKKLKIIKWLGRITRHRGWWHTLTGTVIYGALIGILMWILQVHFWTYPVLFGMFGYWSHLLGDDINTIKKQTNMPFVSVRLFPKKTNK